MNNSVELYFDVTLGAGNVANVAVFTSDTTTVDLPLGALASLYVRGEEPMRGAIRVHVFADPPTPDPCNGRLSLYEKSGLLLVEQAAGLEYVDLEISEEFQTYVLELELAGVTTTCMEFQIGTIGPEVAGDGIEIELDIKPPTGNPPYARRVLVSRSLPSAGATILSRNGGPPVS